MNFKKLISLVASTALSVSLLSCNNPLLGPGDNVGTVGDLKISTSEFKYFLTNQKNATEEQAGLTGKSEAEKKKFWDEKEGDKTRKQLIIDSTLEGVAKIKVSLICAKEDNVKLGTEDLKEVTKAMDEVVKAENKPSKGEAEKAIVEKYGINLTELRKSYEDLKLGMYKYPAAQVEKMKVKDEDIKSEYDNNKENYNKVTVKHVLIMTQDATQKPLAEDKLAEKKKLADEILEKAKNGTDFESLVKEYSEDPGSKDKGGEYTFGKNEMVKEFEDWAFKAKENDLGIVKTTYGYHVMKFIKSASSFEDQKAAIKTNLQQVEFQKKIEAAQKKYPLKKDQKVIDSLNVFK